MLGIATFDSRPAARATFDRFSDAEVRLLLGFRAIFGALLLALAALGRIPPA